LGEDNEFHRARPTAEKAQQENHHEANAGQPDARPRKHAMIHTIHAASGECGSNQSKNVWAGFLHFVLRGLIAANGIVWPGLAGHWSIAKLGAWFLFTPVRTAGQARFFAAPFSRAQPSAFGWLACCVTVLLGVSAQADSTLRTDDPEAFFNNLGARLLRSQMNLDLGRLQVWPANQYTPAVHRLLQVTANLYDSTTSRFNAEPPHLPTVFRPLFTNDDGSIYICGYTEESGDACLTNRWLDLSRTEDREAIETRSYVHGIPFVIGVKKGFPNFNEFTLQSTFQVARKLQITRPSLHAPRSQYETNQMFVLGITNHLGVEAWNSYLSNYVRSVDILVTVETGISLLDDTGLLATQRVSVPAALSFASHTWPGSEFKTSPNSNSFQVLIATNFTFLPESVYQHSPPGLTTNLDAPFAAGLGFPTPQWGLTLTNRLRFFMVDQETRRLVDFVTLDGLGIVRDLSAEIDLAGNFGMPGFDSLWVTNHAGNSTKVLAPTFGVLNQLDISLRYGYSGSGDWRYYGFMPVGRSPEGSVDNCRAFFGYAPYFGNRIINTNLAQPAPFTPALRISHYQTWQAADPLVHQLTSDLNLLGLTNHLRRELLSAPLPVLENIGRLNNRYQPWGGNFQAPDPHRFNPALKDPLVSSPNQWTFPNNESLNAALLGRVHRGTPWQTLYLKSAVADLGTWQNWTGNTDPRDAERTLPVNDWRVAALIASLLNTNRPQELASANPTSPTNWLPVLDGLVVLTNSMTDTQVLLLQLNIPRPFPVYDSLDMTRDSEQTALIANAILATRASRPGGVFRDPGDVFATPELSLTSPWLNRSTTMQVQYGITDEACEAIPSQLLARLRADSEGVVAQSNGILHVKFSGFDGHAYAVESSSNLRDWLPVSTNHPGNGFFIFTEPVVAPESPQFYRSVLLP
jgi:hypothetical protein